MSRREEYQNCIINSDPHRLQTGGFSSNGTIEIHRSDSMDDLRLFDLQAQEFNDENAADEFYIAAAKKWIDSELANESFR